jgi:lipid A 4'-phosphatase
MTSVAPRTAVAPADRRDRDWRRDLTVLLGLGVLATILFAATPLDIAAERIFYRPGEVDHWPLATRPPFSVLYKMAPLITASLVLAGLAGLAVGVAYRREAWRRDAVFVLLSVVLGPGILINAVFKDHWNRPRPRDVVELGGAMRYVPAPLIGESGKSFPCGHCSVGYLYAVGWWIWRRRKPAWAAASLATGLALGTALGIGRMAAGGHFLSDAVWSAIIALSVAHALYHYVLRIPAREGRAAELAPEGGPIPGRQRAVVVLAALGGLAVLLALFAMPHGAQLSASVPLAPLSRPPEVFEVTARTANIEITVVDSPATEVSISGELHGFGLPTSRLGASTHFVAEPVPTLHYRIDQRGPFTDLDGSASIRVPLGGLKRIVVRLQKGNVKLTDETLEGVVASGQLRLDLQTKSGRVLQVPGPARQRVEGP